MPNNGKANPDDTVVTTFIGGVGTIQLDPAANARYTPSHKVAVFATYEMSCKYVTTRNRVQLPIASSSSSKAKATAVIVQLARSTSRVIVRIRAERTGEWPEIPNPEIDITGADGTKYWLMDFDIEPAVPQAGNDGSAVRAPLAIQCRYVYAADRECKQYDAGRSPIFAHGLFSNMVPAAALRPDLFSPGNLGGVGGGFVQR